MLGIDSLVALARSSLARVAAASGVVLTAPPSTVTLERQLHQTKPRVSIIIPCYNRASFIAKTLDSICKQSFKDFEVIVIDDASTDNSAAIIQEIAQKDTRIKYIKNKTNQERSVSRNVGITRAQGEYICFIDSDDLWHPQKLEQQIKVMDNNPKLVCCYTDYNRIDANDKAVAPYPRQHMGYSGEIFFNLLQTNVICSATPMVRKDAIKAIDGFKTEHIPAEDWDYWLRLAKLGEFHYIAKPLASYRVHENQSIAEVNPRQYKKNHINIIEENSRELGTLLARLKAKQEKKHRSPRPGLIIRPSDPMSLARRVLINYFETIPSGLIDQSKAEQLVRRAKSLALMRSADYYTDKGQAKKALALLGKSAILDRSRLYDPQWLLYQYRAKSLQRKNTPKLK